MNKTNLVTLSCLGLLMTEASHATWAAHLDAIVDKRPTIAVQLPTQQEILRTRAVPTQAPAQQTVLHMPAAPTLATLQLSHGHLPTQQEILRTRAVPTQVPSLARSPQTVLHSPMAPTLATLQHAIAPVQVASQQQVAPVTPAPQTQLLNHIADLQATIARMQADAEIQAEANEFIRMAEEEDAEDMQQALRQNSLLRQAAERDLGEAELDLANKALALDQLSAHNAEIVRVYETKIAEHRKDYFDARSKKKTYKARLTTLSATIEDLRNELELIKNARSPNRAARTDLLQENVQLDQMLTALVEEKCELENRIAELMKAMAENKTPEDFDREQLLTENMALLKIMKVLDAERDELQARLDRIEIESEAASKKLKTETSNKEIHKAKIKKLSEDHKALKEKNEELLKLISRLKLVDGMVEDENNGGNVRLGALLALAHGVEETTPKLNYDKINRSLDEIVALDVSVGTMTPVVSNNNRPGFLTPGITENPAFAETFDFAERIKARRSQGPEQLETSPQTEDSRNHELSMILKTFEPGQDHNTEAETDMLSKSNLELISRALAQAEDAAEEQSDREKSNTTFNLDDSVAEGSPGNQPDAVDVVSSDISFGDIFGPSSPIIINRNANSVAAAHAKEGKQPLTADQEEAPLSDKENGEAARVTDEAKHARPNPSFFLQKVGIDESF